MSAHAKQVKQVSVLRPGSIVCDEPYANEQNPLFSLISISFGAVRLNCNSFNIPSCRRLKTAFSDRFTGRGIQREYSSKPLKHSIVERILVFKQ